MNFIANNLRKHPLITYKNVKKIIRNQKNKPPINRNSFHIADHYIPSIKKAFKIKSKETIQLIQQNWNSAINKEIEWGEETGVADEKEIYQIKRINLMEIIKILNLAPITRELKLSPEVGYVFAMGIVYANFVFESTSMCLTIKEIYRTIPIRCRKNITLTKFKNLFIVEGTSEKINKILYCN